MKRIGKVVGLLALYAVCIGVIALAGASFVTRNSHEVCRQLDDGTVVAYIFHTSQPDSCLVPEFACADSLQAYIVARPDSLGFDEELVEIAWNKPTDDAKIYLWNDYTFEKGKLERVIHNNTRYRPGVKISC